MPRHAYRLVQYIEPDTDSPIGIPRPMVPIRIANPATGLTTAPTYALLDTGADSCVFRGDTAMAVGHALRGKGVAASVNTGLGNMHVQVFRHTFVIELLDADCVKTIWRSPPVEIDCLEADMDEHPEILGCADFLRHFKLTFDYPGNQVVFRW